MPGNAFAVVGHFAKKVRTPGDHVFTQQVADIRDDPAIGQKIIDAAVLEMGRADRIARSTRGQDAGQEIVEIATILQTLGLVENTNALEISVAVELLDLCDRESLRMFIVDGMEAQVAIHLVDLVLAGNDLEFGGPCHTNS